MHSTTFDISFYSQSAISTWNAFFTFIHEVKYHPSSLSSPMAVYNSYSYSEKYNKNVEFFWHGEVLPILYSFCDKF